MPVSDGVRQRGISWGGRGRHCRAARCSHIAGRGVALAGALRRAARYAWHWLTPEGRLMVLLFFCWPLGQLAGDMHLVPDHAPWTTVAAFTIGGTGALGLLLNRLAGQRAWRRSRGRGNPVIQGGTALEGSIRATADGCTERFSQSRARLDAVEADQADLRSRVLALSAGLAAALDSAGQPPALHDAAQEAARPALYLVETQDTA